MQSPPGRVASKSYGTPEWVSYQDVSAEYYDERLHPTCADFRVASHTYLTTVFGNEFPTGAVADIGCGLSLVSEFCRTGLVLVDAAPSMLKLNDDRHERRLVNIVESPFGENEFDWIFAVLGDPYNESGAWRNISTALKPQGQCVFIVPSIDWAKKFRSASKNEVDGKARFDLSSGEAIFLPSIILPISEQCDLIGGASLHVDRVEHIYVNQMAEIKSAKILNILGRDEAILDIYRVRK